MQANHVVLSHIHPLCQHWPARPDLAGPAAPGFSGRLRSGLVEGLPDRTSEDNVLTV